MYNSSFWVCVWCFFVLGVFVLLVLLFLVFFVIVGDIREEILVGVCFIFVIVFIVVVFIFVCCCFYLKVLVVGYFFLKNIK